MGSRAKRWMKSREEYCFGDHGGSFLACGRLVAICLDEGGVGSDHPPQLWCDPPDRALIELERFLGPNARISSTVQGRAIVRLQAGLGIHDWKPGLIVHAFEEYSNGRYIGALLQVTSKGIRKSRNWGFGIIAARFDVDESGGFVAVCLEGGWNTVVGGGSGIWLWVASKAIRKSRNVFLDHWFSAKSCWLNMNAFVQDQSCQRLSSTEYASQREEY